MLDPQSLAEFSLDVAKTVENSDLDQRLGLYRVFLKLYEHHRELLDEILSLEHVNDHAIVHETVRYVQGIVQGDQIYLITNLVQGGTRSLYQPQGVWLLGRDRTAAIQIADKRLSRRHAAIQYIPNQGFYLVDLNSTNGSFVNGELVRHSMRLKDGDRIRLGSMAFNFFVCGVANTVEPIAPDFLAEVNATHRHPMPSNSKATLPDFGYPLPTSTPEEAVSLEAPVDEAVVANLDETSMFLLSQSSN